MAVGVVEPPEVGVTATVPEAALMPALLLAVTLQLKGVPLARPATAIGLAVPVPLALVEPLTQVAV